MPWTYLQPTNYELVRLAQAVVLGRASELRSLPSSYGERLQEAVLVALGNRKDPEGATLVLELISKNSNLGDWRAAIARIAATSSDERVVDWLFAQARDSSLDYSSEWSILGALVEGEGSRPADRMLELLRSADDEHAAFISKWFQRNPSRAAVDELFRRLGAATEEESDFAIALAGLGDDRVLGTENPARGEPWHHSWVRNYAIASSPRPEADAELRALISSAKVKDLTEVAQGLSSSTAPQRDQRLRLILEKGPVQKQLRCWLLKTAKTLEYKEPENPVFRAFVVDIESVHQGDQALPLVCD